MTGVTRRTVRGVTVPRVLDALDAPAVARWCAAGLAALTLHRQEIDDLNVYPVPDGDTGTNLALTWESVGQALADAATEAGEPPDLRRAITAMARGALLGARGNSGVILSQLLRGLAEVLAPLPAARGAALAAALVRAAESAYAAVAAPVEGTVLSVARAAGAAAGAAEPADDLAAVVRAAARGAREALAETPRQLAVLARAGVVDAGGRGLVVLLEALSAVVTGDLPADSDVAAAGPATRAEAVESNERVESNEAVESHESHESHESPDGEFGYEVQYLLATDPGTEDADMSVLRRTLAGLGDSLVVVGGEGSWNVHVHVDDVGAAFEAGVLAGRPHRVTVTRFADQHAAAGGRLTAACAAESAGSAAVDGAAAGAQPTGRAVVAVVPGAGLRALFASAGVRVVPGGPGAAPSTREVLDAVEATGAAQVVLLPNEGNVLAVAQQAAATARAATGRREVVVVPTRSPVQGLAAVAVADPDRRFADDVVAMTEAAGGCRWAEVTHAVRDSLTSAGAVTAGQVLGLVTGEVVLVGADVVAVAVGLADLLLASGGELLTMVVGADLPPQDAARLEAALVAGHPTVEVVAVEGGQPHYPLLLGVE